MNTTGTLRVLKLAETMEKLQVSDKTKHTVDHRL